MATKNTYRVPSVVSMEIFKGIEDTWLQKVK